MQFTQSCLTLCDPMDCITPGFPVHQQLLELAQTHVHRVSDAQKWGIAIKRELKHVRMLLNLDVGGTQMDTEKEMETQRASWVCKQKPDGPWRGCQWQLPGKRRKWHKHGGMETLATNQLKVKSVRRISYETKKSTIKYKGTRTHWVQYLYPLYSISTCPIVTWGKKTEMASWLR